METFNLDFWTSEETAAVLKELSSSPITADKEFKILQNLRRTYSPALAGELLSCAKLRQKAVKKFPQAEKMFFTAQALEQSTAWDLAVHRAEKLHKISGPGPILDLGCGIGGDALAMAQFRPVIAADLDLNRLNMLKANALALKTPFPIETLHADYLKTELPKAAAVFADPARRENGKRIFNIQDIQPPLSEIESLLKGLGVPSAVKLSPSFDKSWLTEHEACLEFCGQSKRCSEAVLWFNTDKLPKVSASVLCSDGWNSFSGNTLEEQKAPIGPIFPGCFLYEIEPAMLRAGALWKIASEIDGYLFDENVSWIVSEKCCFHKLADTFKAEIIEKFSLKQLQKYISSRDIGILEIKKRNSAVEPDEIRSKLKLTKSKNEMTVFATRQNGKPLMILGSRLSHK